MPRKTCVLALCLLSPGLSLAAAVSVVVTPGTATIRLGAQRTFTATVSNTTNKTVTWSVNGAAGGSSALGTISAAGVYTAPLVMPAGNAVTIRAVSAASATATASSAVSLQNPVPIMSSLSPQWLTVGNFTLTITGQGFVSGTTATFGGVAVPVTYVSPSQIVLRGTAPGPGNTLVPLVLSNPNPGAVNSATVNVTVAPAVTVSVTPGSPALRPGATQQFSALVPSPQDKTVAWRVNGVTGGSSATGTITAAGLYTAPAQPAAGNAVTVTAVSNADPTASGSAAVTLQNPIPTLTAMSPASLPPGTVTLTLTGTGFVAGAQVNVGANTFAASLVSSTQLTATVTVNPLPGGITTIAVTNPNPGGAATATLYAPVAVVNPQVSYGDAARLLEQATWGPTPAAIASLQSGGVNQFFASQLQAPQSVYADPPNTTTSALPVMQRFFTNAINRQDQLRQRMAYSLGKIFTISANKVNFAHMLVPYQRLLLAGALGNYFDLMRSVTLSPTMGRYLDMVNSVKPTPGMGIAANENYARELLQLFTLGPVLLNPDGTVQTDSMGNPAPAYSESTVTALALALTGWTYPTQPGATLQQFNPQYFTGPMEAWEPSHDTTAKTLLNGFQLPAGGTAAGDLNAALQNIFQHPNVAPFVSKNLIQQLVMSNPSPAYVQRVATVFNDNGAGVRGDLFAVAKAILTDPEAAGDGPGQGHLREPVLYATTLYRALGSTVDDSNQIGFLCEQMGQKLFFPPSVFGFFSPAYRIPGTPSLGPEFQLHNGANALARLNFVNNVVNAVNYGNVLTDPGPFLRVAGDANTLLAALGNAFFRGQMSPALQSAILPAVNAVSGSAARASMATYLAAVSSRYQVQR